MVETLSPTARCFLLSPKDDPQEVKRRLQRELPAILVQVASHRAVRNEGVVELIAWQSLSAQKAGCLLAKTPEMDLLLRLSGTNQISKAIKESGARRREENVLILAGDLQDYRIPRLAGLLPKRRLQRRELTEEEIMIVERAAMLNAGRT